MHEILLILNEFDNVVLIIDMHCASRTSRDRTRHVFELMLGVVEPLESRSSLDVELLGELESPVESNSALLSELLDASPERVHCGQLRVQISQVVVTLSRSIN